MPRRPRQYDVLLRIRQLQQHLQSQVLAEARRAVGLAEQERATMSEQRVAILAEAGELAHDDVDTSELRSYFQYERILMRMINAKDAEIHHLQGEAEQQRLELENRMKRRRVVEKLRERKLQAYMDAVRRDEQKFSDEMATNAAAGPGHAARHGEGQ